MRLGRVLYRWRQVEDLDLRKASKQMGLTATTLMRIEHGRKPTSETLMKILNWLTADEDKR